MPRDIETLRLENLYWPACLPVAWPRPHPTKPFCLNTCGNYRSASLDEGKRAATAFTECNLYRVCSMQLQSTACKVVRVFFYARKRTANSDAHCEACAVFQRSPRILILIFQAERRNFETERTNNVMNPNPFKTFIFSSSVFYVLLDLSLNKNERRLNLMKESMTERR
ncbi:hypothetical protein K0M31_010326 [Melipona bicolor]|uniref:Uncharacterized protein n=1 Tax=Melipona bicolor TaxID=60889 RepID=A0AA40FLR9_9HYME|nr:hypothetical protein K0M31_010326 [Melipona bicolor]